MNFKVGDRVRYIGLMYRKHKGKIYTLQEKITGSLWRIVETDEFFPLEMYLELVHSSESFEGELDFEI